MNPGVDVNPCGLLVDRFTALWGAGGPPPDVFAFLGEHPEATAAERLAIVLVDQELRWRAGTPLPVAAYLDAAPGLAADSEAGDELRLRELQLRIKHGETLAESTPRPEPQLPLPPRPEPKWPTSPFEPLRDLPTVAGTAPVEPSTSPLSSLARLQPSTGINAPTSTRDIHRESTDADFSLDSDIDTEAAGDSTERLLSTSRFTVEGRLGTGGMGVVYRARDPDRGEVVALKTMRRIDPRSLYRFKQEFRTLADLSHPNLVNLYELVASGDLWYFTMELIEGTDLITHVRALADHTGPGGPADANGRGAVGRTPAGAALTPAQVQRLRRALGQLAEGIAALHDAGKLHRDIKPTNVLVTPQGRVVLLDFGLAADLGPSGRHENQGEPIVGTLAYMAPEQGTGEPVSPSCDWYSVGVILFVALTGRLPFDDQSRAVLARKLESEPPPPATLAAGVPADLDALCVDLLRRDPAARPKGRAVLARLAVASPAGSEGPGTDQSRAVADPGPDHEGQGPSSVPGRGAVAPVGEPRVREAATPGLACLSLPAPAACSTPSPGLAGPLIGRERHRAVLRAAFESVRCGNPEMIFVSGRSGSGKSTLLQAFLDELRASDDAIVLSGRCYERESVPYKAIDSVVDALSHYLKPLPVAETRALLPCDTALLARVFPVLQRVEAVASAPRPAFESPDRQELRRRAFAALRTLLARIGRRGPLVVAIDDLQWANPENAPMLAELVRPPDAPVLLLLGSYRSEDVPTSPFLRSLLGSDPDEPSSSRLSLRFQELSVGALSQMESRTLALALLGRDDPITRAEAHLVARESQGNPFFLDELVKHLQAGGFAHRLPSAGAITLDEVLWTRVGRLSDDARRLLGIVAVSGRPIRQDLAFLAAGLASEGRAAVGLLRSSRLIRITGATQREAIEVYHDRIRETVVSRLPAGVLQDHHLRLAESLEATGHADPEMLAVQYQGAGRNQKAGHYFELAADSAAESLAFAHAARLYYRAIDLRCGDQSGSVFDTAPLFRRLGDALANSGHGGEAAGAYLAATAGASVAGALELKRRATMQLLISGRVDEGLAELRAVLAPLGMALPSSPRRSLAWLIVRRARLKLRGYGFQRRDTSQLSAEMLTRIDLCWSAATGLSLIDPICGAEFQSRGLLFALEAGEPYRVARALTLEAMHLSTAGGASRRQVAGLLDTAKPLAEEVRHPHALGMIPLAEATAALMLGRWREARDAFGRAEATFRERCTGVAWELDTVHNLALWATAHMGELAEMRGRWSALLHEAEERGDLYAITMLNTLSMTILRLADDDPEDARRELAAVMGRWSHRGFHVQHSTAFRAHVLIDLYLGDGLSAWRRIRDHWGLYRRSQLLRVQMLRVELLELRGRVALAAALAADRPGPFLRAAARDAQRLDREREPWARAFAQLLRAGLAAARGDRDRAFTLFSAAADQFDAADMKLNAAAARRRLGELLGGGPGQSFISRADDWMRTQTIRDPARMAAIYAPGLPAPAGQGPGGQTFLFETIK